MKKERTQVVVKLPGYGDEEFVNYVKPGAEERDLLDYYERSDVEVVSIVREQSHGWDSEGRPL